MVFVQKWPLFQLFFYSIQARKMSLTIFLSKKNAFLGFKNKKFKRSKNVHFCKGVNPWFWFKNGYFSNFYFWAIQARKISFTIFQSEKTPFQAMKTRSSESRKIDIFPKGLTHGFAPKIAIFPTFMFGQYRQGKCLYDILKQKKSLSRL